MFTWFDIFIYISPVMWTLPLYIVSPISNTMCVFCHCCIGSLERFYHNSYVLFCNLPQDLISYKSLVLFTSSMLVKVCCIRQPTYAAIHLLDACRSMLYTTADIRVYSPPRCLSKYVVYNCRHTLLLTSSMLVKVCCIQLPTYASTHLLDACQSMLYTTADIRVYSPPRCLSKYVVYDSRHTPFRVMYIQCQVQAWYTCNKYDVLCSCLRLWPKHTTVRHK